ncbi:hypothetical protein GCM10023322_32420 [Rugosimonospora acidiphila]|uniref:Uncharacterized protein n=1 Tax=Rugosimonospora acidiphila TaxID=556531 RepID=A0ABP9RUM1_9ACTN
MQLNDPGKALLRVLDASRTERLSLTTALGRLLETEVEATEPRRTAAGRRRFSWLAEAWTVADFDFAAQPWCEVNCAH